VDQHLLGPPLERWLDDRLGAQELSLWVDPEIRTGTEELRGRRWGSGRDGVVVVTEIVERCRVPAGVLASVRPGGWVIELGVPPRWSWRPRRWWARRQLVRRAGELRAGDWLARGVYAVEQWTPADAPRRLVTCGRVRAIV